MKKPKTTKKLIVFAAAFAFVLTLFMLAAVSATTETSSTSVEEAVRWEQILKDFLKTNFPSLFDEATIKSNEELLKKWEEERYSGNMYKPDPSDIPIDAFEIDGEKWHDDWGYYPLLLPYECEFYDLDNDGIPEAIIVYPNQWSEKV